MLQRLLKETGMTTAVFDGNTSQDYRRAIINGEIDPQVLLIQIKCGGCGINLQRFNRIFITSPDWNPANEFQAIARAWRNGQKKQVKMTRILLSRKRGKSTIDQRIMQLQMEKTQLQAEVTRDDDLLKTHTYKITKGRNMGNLNASNYAQLLGV